MRFAQGQEPKKAAPAKTARPGEDHAFPLALARPIGAQSVAEPGEDVIEFNGCLVHRSHVYSL